MNGNKNENARPKAPKQKMSKILKNNLLLLKKTAKLTPDYFILTFVEGVVWGIINSAISLFTVYCIGRCFAKGIRRRNRVTSFDALWKH